MSSTFVQDNEYLLDDDDESEKEDEDKGDAENEEEFGILIYSNLPITYSFKNRKNNLDERLSLFKKIFSFIIPSQH